MTAVDLTHMDIASVSSAQHLDDAIVAVVSPSGTDSSMSRSCWQLATEFADLLVLIDMVRSYHRGSVA